MHPLWKRLLTKTSNLLPDFNDFLLLKFRKKKIDQIRDYLDNLFTQTVTMFDDPDTQTSRLHYIGWEELSPDERLEYIKTNNISKQKIEIQDSSFELLRFKFEFENVIYPLYIYVPYMEHNCIVYQDTKYFPLFPIIERGGLHRTSREVLIKVMRAPIIFRRTESFQFTTTKRDKLYKETVVTVRIHQKKQGKKGSHSIRTPLILYHLVKFQLQQVLAMYRFNPDEFMIVDRELEEPGYQYIFVKDGVYIRIMDTTLDDISKRRFIASYLMCLAEYPNFHIGDLNTRHQDYYKTILGKFIYRNSTNGHLLHDNAERHLETTDTLLDPPAKYQLSQIGIQASDIYELLLVAFFEVDNWIVSYKPTNLYDKKIGSLDQIMAPVVSDVNRMLFKIINNRKVGLTPETVNDFVKTVSKPPSWITKSSSFRANPSICNDNWLIAIGAQRFRSLENTETQSQNNSGHNMPKDLLKADPSQLVVESVLTYPPSAPIITGTINPFLQIDEDGNIIRPEWADELEHIFD